MDVVILSGGIRGSELMRSVGPYKIAHWLRKHGHTCQVIDFVPRFCKEDLLQLLFKVITSETKIVAISTTFISNTVYKWSNGAEGRMPQDIVSALTQIKSLYPHIKCVLGGYMSERLSGWDVIDATVMSYTEASEDIMLEYLEHLKFGKQAPISKILIPSYGRNSSFKKKFRFHFYEARNKKYNIETDDFRFSDQDFILPGEPLPLDVSRGCIFACKFCQYPHLGKKKFDYIRGMEYLEEELLHNYEKFGTTTYYMLDDTFNDSEYKMDAFYKMTQRLPFKIDYFAYIRADLIHRFPSMIDTLQGSGLWGCFNGIETFHPTASKLVAKGWSGTHAKDFLPKLYHDHWNRKIHHHANFIVGITGDTRENVDDTVKWYIENDMCSIKFVGLGLYGPHDTSKYTILSEFDKNAEKYGFTWVENVRTKGGAPIWKNDNWDAFTADVYAIETSKSLDPIKKVETWKATTLLWYGYTREQLLNIKKPEVNWNGVVNETSLRVQNYYERVMAS